MDKCYWSFVRELIPSEERIDLKQKWNCSNRRELSLAWLKDSLNRLGFWKYSFSNWEFFFWIWAYNGRHEGRKNFWWIFWESFFKML